MQDKLCHDDTVDLIKIIDLMFVDDDDVGGWRCFWIIFVDQIWNVKDKGWPESVGLPILASHVLCSYKVFTDVHCSLYTLCVWTLCTVSVHTTSSVDILLKPWKCHSTMKNSLKFRIYPCYHCNGTKIMVIGLSIKAKLTVNAVL